MRKILIVYLFEKFSSHEPDLSKLSKFRLYM